MTTIIVLGMHRSGTSCVTRALHEGGAYLGERLMNETATDNLEGHWESWQAVEINEAILAASGAAWDRVPTDLALQMPEGIEPRMASFLAQLNTHPISGFKDPRTLLTLPLWQPRLAEPRYVACLRHPYNVARSLAKRTTEWKWETGLELWRQYNQRLLRYADGIDPELLHWFDFDGEPRQVQASLERLLAWLGLNAAPERFNQFLRHNDELPAIEEPPLAELYARLRQRATDQQSQWASAAESREPDLNLQLRQLRTLNAKYDEVIQRQQHLIERQQHSIWSLEARLQELHRQTEAEICQVRSGAEETQRRAQALETSLAKQTEMWRRAMEIRVAYAAQSLEDQVGHQLDHQHQQHASLGAVVFDLHERTSRLEQQLFWPLVKRKARGALRRLKRKLPFRPAA